MKNPFENFENFGQVKSDLEEYQHPGEEESKDVLESEEEKPNFSIFYLLCFFISFILIFRLLDLQVAQGAKNQYLAEGNRIRERNIPAPRGNIYDSTGKILAKNTPSFSLEIYPADLPRDKEEREKIYQRLSDVSQISQDEIKSKIEKVGLFSLEPITLKENIVRDEALLLEIRYKDLSGVVLTKEPVRIYESLPGLSHVLGYVGKVSEKELKQNSTYQLTDNVGKSGVEQSYENSLRGTDGQEQIEVDSVGRIQRILATKEPVAGNNLYLTIDAALQNEIAKDLQEGMKDLNINTGIVIAMDPQTGVILGSVSLPSYDNNIFTKANLNEEYDKLIDSPDKPMINRTIAGVYPIGSTIKPIIAVAGLQEKAISENTTVNDTGEIKIGEWTFPDWKVHGLVDVRKAIAESCDIFFYAVGGGYDKISGLGINKVDSYLEKFGFGEKTGIDISGEAFGLVPSPQWKKKIKKEAWYIGDTYHLSIGQGDFLATPLQLVNAISAIANGGKLNVPHVALKETDSSGKLIKDYSFQAAKTELADSYNINIVREGMKQAVTSGSARQLNDLVDKDGGPVESGAKTGTAQFDNNRRTHSWFTAFAPYDNPKIALVVLVEGGGEGNVVAEPIAKKILQYFFSR